MLHVTSGKRGWEGGMLRPLLNFLICRKWSTSVGIARVQSIKTSVIARTDVPVRLLDEGRARGRAAWLEQILFLPIQQGCIPQKSCTCDSLGPWVSSTGHGSSM